MNKKILTRVLSFVLVICLLVPMIPNLGLDLFSVEADAAMPTPSSTAILFKTGSGYYWKSGTTDTAIAKIGGVQPKPFYSSGAYYLPIEAVKTATGQTSATLTASDTVNGVDYVKVTHGGTLTGSWKTYISSMGFIQVTTGSDTISSATDAEQTAWIKANVFDHGSNASAFTAPTFDANGNVTNNGSMQSLDHPYLLADQSEFDSLYNTWAGNSDDEILKDYLLYLAGVASSTFDRYVKTYDKENLTVTLKAEYLENGEKDLTQQPMNKKVNGSNYDKYGYDVGGRQSYSVNIAQDIERLAYAYQITRDAKYAVLALELSLHLANWYHWGAGHFLNAADTSYHMALVYDWCYDVWGTADNAETTDVIEGLGRSGDRDTVAKALFTKGVMAGVYDSIGNSKATYTEKDGIFGSNVTKTYRVNAWYNSTLSGGSGIYNTRENNWNGVCSSGMIMAALALMSENEDVSAYEINAINSSGTITSTTLFNDSYFTLSYKSGITTKTYKISQALSANGVSASTFSTMGSAGTWLINNNLKNLETYGLAQYIPDGSYIESANYWSYGTNSIFRTIASLEQTCGTDFGLSAAGGLDRTMYFSYHAQSSDGISWRYHDDASSTIDTGMNALYGSVIGDNAAVAYRKYLIEKGVSNPTVYDTFNYDASVNDFDRMPLDYYMPAIQGYTMRDTWEKDSIYVAFQGGPNYVNHGQIDSGAFVYHNNGTAWFQDIGSEEYNAYEFGYGTQTIQNTETFASGNTMYYPNTAEGNNTLVSKDTTNTPFGQKWGKSVGASGTISKYVSNDHGSYAVLDQTSVYNASSAKRGILMTNDRKTVVIQDEITYSKSTQSYWVGHLGTGISVELADDDKTAYLNDGKTTIRVSIVGNDSLTFQTMTADEHLLGNTADNDYSANQGATASKDFSNITKLVIDIPATTSVAFAVVIEEVTVFSSDEVGYTYTSMSSWSDSTLARDDTQYDDKILLSKDFDVDGIGTFSSISGNLRVANTFIDGDNAMGAYFNAGNTNASKITLTSAPARANTGYLNGMVVTEFDILTLDTLPEEVKFELYGTDIYPIVSVDASKLGTPTDWTHVTMVIDEDNNVFYLYVGDTCVLTDANFESKSYKDLKLVISTEAGAIADGTLLIDNVVIRTFSDTYTGLDNVLSGSSDISDWTDTTKETVTEFEGNVAKLWYTEIDAPPADDDTPIIDFWTDAVVVSTNDTEAEASVVTDPGEVYVTSFAALEAAINSGSYTDVELYTGNTRNPINITLSKRIVVDTNGHDFYATADNLVCVVDGDIHTYKKGTIQVKFVINGATTKVTYSNTKLATYNVSAGSVGRLVERDNGDGTYSYIVTEANTWSDAPYGNPITGYALLATSENNTFYLTGNPYSGIYVTIKDNVVTAGGSDPASFYELIETAGDYDKICVTNDFYYDGSSDGKNNAVIGTKNVYLNGHTITFYSSVSSDHMFSVKPGNAINVYGPGTIDNDATAANVIYKADGHAADADAKKFKSTFNNLTVVSTYQVTDVREGVVEFNNCNVSRENYGNVFGVSNYSTDKNGSGNRGRNYTTIDNHIGTLVLNGGTMTNYSSSGTASIVTVENNARLVLKGGVNLVSPRSYGAITLTHSSTTTDTKVDTTGIDLMYVHLGDVHYTAQNLYYYHVYDDITAVDEATVIPTHFKWIEGAGFTSPETLSATGIGMLDGHVLAQTGSAGYAYRVVEMSHAASVQWSDTTAEPDVTTDPEYWVEGATPIMNQGVKDYLNGLAKETGKKWTCDLSALGGKGVTGGMSYTFEAKQISDLQLRMNLSLYNDLVVNIYVERRADAPYEYVKINGKTVEIAGATTIDGKSFYVYVIEDIAPQNASELITISVKLSDGTEITAVTSILNYANKLLDSANQSNEMKSLMYSIVQYIGAGSAYAGKLYDKASCDAILANYSTYATEADVNKTVEPDMNNVKVAVKSVYLDLAGAPTYAFRFNSGFSGSVTFSYTSANKQKDGTYLVSETVEVSGGKIAGTDSSVYILAMKAYDMATNVSITVDEGEASDYNLDIYYVQAVQDRDALYDLICALKAYCDAANAYKETV